MNCVICKTGNTQPGKTTVTLQRVGTVIVVRDVPAEVCDNCGEYFLDALTTQRVYADAVQSIGRRVEVEIQRYAA